MNECLFSGTGSPGLSWTKGSWWVVVGVLGDDIHICWQYRSDVEELQSPNQRLYGIVRSQTPRSLWFR